MLTNKGITTIHVTPIIHSRSLHLHVFQVDQTFLMEGLGGRHQGAEVTKVIGVCVHNLLHVGPQLLQHHVIVGLDIMESLLHLYNSTTMAVGM